jgi:hypothetical protein
MPLFARRRLQAMLDELQPKLVGSKGRDLLVRLEKKQIDQALPAEMELAVLWALSRLGPLEIEPTWFPSTRLPDAASEMLFRGRRTVLEVAALSDASLPGDEGMRNSHRKLCQLAGAIRKGAGKRISSYFLEESFHASGKYTRRIKAPRSLDIGPEIQARLQAWLQPDLPPPGDRLHLREADLDVVLTWHDQVQHGFAFGSSMPPEVHDLVDNHLCAVLTREADQLKATAFTDLRCLVLADVGSTLLRRIDDLDSTHRRVSGAQIIRAFLHRPRPGLDVVVVLSPNRHTPLNAYRTELAWKVSAFGRPGAAPLSGDGIDRLVGQLPTPRFEGYQARQLHEQGLYAHDARPWSVGTTILSGDRRMTYKVSSRVLLEVLAGVTPASELLDRRGDGNLLLYKIRHGRTIQAMRLEPGGVDEDDDYAVFEFADDPAALPLKV